MRRSADFMARLAFVGACLTIVAMMAGGISAQTIIPTPFVTNFYDTTYSSTFAGDSLPVGSIVEAYDPDSVLCGIDTVTLTGAYGFMVAYGDDSNTESVDEGAVAGDSISFKINGRDATIVAGDPTWAHLTEQNVQLDVPAMDVVIAMTAISQPGVTLVAPGDTVQMEIEVRNDGNGLDFYGITIGMTGATGSNELTEWEAIVPDTLVYASSSETVTFRFDVRAPIWPGDTTNTLSYTLYSRLDTTVKIEDDVLVYATVTDADEDDIPNLPGAFTLAQNYPNPFNPTTTIAFELSSRSTVRFEVFDILGRQIEDRYLGSLSAGEHRVEFDGSDLATGVYFYRVSTERIAQRKKMLLVK